MAPEGHGAQVLPDLGSEKLTQSHKIRGALQLLFYKFSPKRTVEAPEAPHTPFMHPVPGVGGTRLNLPPSRTTSVPNFIPIRPAVWISIENRHTDRHKHIALYILDWPVCG